jgi:hypothetical protein
MNTLGEQLSAWAGELGDKANTKISSDLALTDNTRALDEQTKSAQALKDALDNAATRIAAGEELIGAAITGSSVNDTSGKFNINANDTVALK